MDCSLGNDFAGRDVVEVQSGNPGNVVNENWHLGSINQAAWATKDGMCNNETSQSDSKPNHEGTFQFEVGSEPPYRRADHSLLVDLAASDRMEAIENMFYKTKLCHRFRDGSCPYISGCKFAHSAEELRKPPRNWKGTVSAHKIQELEFSEPREVVQIPLVGFDDMADSEGPNVREARSYCKDYLSGFGCMYGENCAYIHREHNKQRQSVAICLLPGTASGNESSESKLLSSAPFRKTRLCKKWESTGFCAYGGICHFAHGLAELLPIGGGLAGREAEGSSMVHANQVAVSAQAPTDVLAPAPAPAPAKAPAPTLVPYSYRVGAPSLTLPKPKQNIGDIPIRKWKGPNKISKIYGDWIDDL